jgi:hypothetical protein
MSRVIRAHVLLAVLAVGAFASQGGDVHTLYQVSDFQCAADNGWDFVIARSYHSNGAVDPNGAANVQNALAGGISYADVYHFPCYGGVSASQQVQDNYNGVQGSGFGTMWFDVEPNPSSGCGWSGDMSANCDFLGQLISAGSSLGIQMGVYASKNTWGSIMGDCTVGADNGLPLWYVHFDSNPSFSDFGGFGGWSAPTMKQYWKAVSICGLNADADWRP